jgi:hypothetical protein
MTNKREFLSFHENVNWVKPFQGKCEVWGDEKHENEKLKELNCSLGKFPFYALL